MSEAKTRQMARARILLVEDNTVDQMAFQRMVKKGQLPFDYKIANSLEDAYQMLSTESFDLVIMDYLLGAKTSMELFDVLQDDVPVILTTGSGNEEVAVQALKSGVYDYMVKDPDYHYLNLLPITVENAIRHKLANDSSRLYASIVENVQTGLLAWQVTPNDDDPELVLINANPAAYQLVGISATEDAGKSLSLIAPFLLQKSIPERLLETSRSNRATDLGEIKLTGRQGQEYIFWITAFPLHQQQVGMSIEDVTERRQTQVALRESEQQFRQVFEGIRDVIFTVSLSGSLTSLNPGFELLTGFRRKDWLDKPVTRLIHPEDLPFALEIISHLTQGEIPPISFELRILHKNNRYVVAELTATPHVQNNEVVGILGIARDITARKQVQLELERAKEAAEEASRAKSAFLANMSHELRTPLTAIIGYSDMLVEDMGEMSPAEMTTDLERIRMAGNHLLSIINNILDLSKIEAGKMDLYPETFSIPELLDDLAATVKPQLDQNANRLVIQLNTDATSIHGDLTKVRQILINLLDNATKFTHHGKIALEVTSFLQDGLKWFRFTVSDTGIGIEREVLAKLFEPFTQEDASTTRKYGGTGLGLAVSRRFCQMMGGRIDAQSIPGKGATFVVELPAVLTIPPLKNTG